MKPQETRSLMERFDANRARLHAIACRLLGSVTDAEDAIQETWLRLSRSDAQDVQNFAAWSTTVASRICLDMLRSRASRREYPEADPELLPAPSAKHGTDPEQEAILADSVGLALLVVLDRLAPAERVAYVLHDMFAVPFDEIASILKRSTVAARQLASRARRRIESEPAPTHRKLVEQSHVVSSFITALRAGDITGILAVLDPQIVRSVDRADASEIRGAADVANESLANIERARFAAVALVDGKVGIIVAPSSKLMVGIQCRVAAGKIIHMNVISDPERLRRLPIHPVRI